MDEQRNRLKIGPKKDLKIYSVIFSMVKQGGCLGGNGADIKQRVKTLWIGQSQLYSLREREVAHGSKKGSLFVAL